MVSIVRVVVEVGVGFGVGVVLAVAITVAVAVVAEFRKRSLQETVDRSNLAFFPGVVGFTIFRGVTSWRIVLQKVELVSRR
jgi:hypothetical protein